MKTGWLWFLLAAMAAAPSHAQIVREGADWVQTATGSATLAGGALLKVSTRGAVVLQGEARQDIGYVLKKRVRAADLARARALLDGVTVKTTRRNGGLALEVSLPAGGAAAADLQLRVPRSLRETSLESQGESIQAYDLDGSLRADSRGGRLQADRIQGDVTVRTGGGMVRLGKVGGNVLCFSGGGTISADMIGGQAGLNTEGGEIYVRMARGLVRASTRGGNIRVDRAERGVTANAQAGLIDVLEAGGPVIAETGAGAIRVRSAGNVECQAGTGAVQLREVFGGLRVAMRSGSILAELAGKPLEDSTLSTGAGDITVLIPSNLAVTIQAINAFPGGRRIVSDFAEIRPRLAQAEGESEAQGTINGGGPLLRLTASGGTIYLRRQKQIP
ncbi:MAG: DUF4097 family beta strand repeat-containing protein [Bryobacteraceae bacterium]